MFLSAINLSHAIGGNEVRKKAAVPKDKSEK